MYRLILPLLTLPILAPEGGAETFSVPSNAHPTIQSALDVAGAGDVVLIAPGAYRENLSIFNGQDGLQLIGRGQVFLDAQGAPEEANDAGFGTTGLVITANDVSVTNITIRHASDVAVRALVPSFADTPGLQGLTLTKVRVIGPGAGFELTAHDTLVQQCELIGTPGGGICVTGDDARIQRTTLRNGGGIFVSGQGATVDSCVLESVTGVGVEIFGAAPTVSRNRLRSVFGGGINLEEADGAVVDRNQLSDIHAGVGIALLGGSSRVQRNIVDGSAEAAFLIASDDSVVLANRALNIGPDLTGAFEIYGIGMLFQKNSVERSSSTGMYMEVESSSIVGNVASRCGGGSSSGLVAIGNLNVLSGNRAQSNAANGILVLGPDNELIRNVARDNGDNGIAVGDADDNVLDGNVALANHGDGLFVFGGATVMRKNRSLKNQQDLSASEPGIIVDAGGNVFQTGGFDSPPVVDDF